MPLAISSQSTIYGRWYNVAMVTMADGHLLLPYGDYGANTGPIDVIGYRPSDGSVVTYLNDLPDERIEDYRRLNGGWIWSCDTDPTGRNEAKVATNSPDGVWKTRTVAVPGKGVAVHQFDIQQLSDGTLFAGVARNFTEAELVTQAALPNFNPDPEYNTGLAAWKSTDQGLTWTEDFVDLKNGDGYYRPYGMAVSNGDLILTTSDGHHFVLHNGVWSGRRMTPTIYCYRPPWQHPDGEHFATSSNGGVMFRSVNGVVIQESITAGTQVIGTGPNGFIETAIISGSHVLYYDGVTYGSLPTPAYGSWRGVVDPDGDVYVSDGVTFLRVDPPVPSS